jgi:hypothetical protein
MEKKKLLERSQGKGNHANIDLASCNTGLVQPNAVVSRP